VYTSDEDDGSTSGKELKEKGYTLPEYHFVAEYGDVKSEKSQTIQIFVYIDGILKNKETGEILPNINYEILLPDGSKREGSTDAYGKISENKLPMGKRKLIIHIKDKED
jgi:hypothetical protein